MKQIDELKVMNPHVAPCCFLHQRFVVENRYKVVVELVEAESYSDGNQRDENVAIVPAESLHGVHPLTRNVIKSSSGILTTHQVKWKFVGSVRKMVKQVRPFTCEKIFPEDGGLWGAVK